MGADIGVLVAGAGEHKQREAADDRSQPVRPSLLRHQSRTPDVAGEESQRREHGRRGADRLVRRLEQHRVDEVADRGGRDGS